MMTKGIGLPCGLTIDFDCGGIPACGDFMRSRAGSCYRILGARKVSSKVHGNRWRLDCERVAADDPAIADAKVKIFGFEWKSRE